MMPLNSLIRTVAGLNRPALERYGRSAARKFGIMLAAGFVFVIAALSVFGFLLWALWEYVRPLVGPVGAPLILAAAASVIVIITALVARNALGSKRQSQYVRTHARTAAVTPEAMLSEAEGIIRKQKVPVLLAAALLGIFAGSQRR